MLVSEVTRALVEDDLPDGVSLRDLGEQHLKDLDRPERLYQLDIEGLPTEFPPLRTAEPETAFAGREGELARRPRRPSQDGASTVEARSSGAVSPA